MDGWIGNHWGFESLLLSPRNSAKRNGKNLPTGGTPGPRVPASNYSSITLALGKFRPFRFLTTKRFLYQKGHAGLRKLLVCLQFRFIFPGPVLVSNEMPD